MQGHVIDNNLTFYIIPTQLLNHKYLMDLNVGLVVRPQPPWVSLAIFNPCYLLVSTKNDIQFNNYNLIQNLGSLRGVHPWKFRKHNYEIVVDPKGPPSRPTFWSGVEALNHKGCAWWPRLFSRQKWSNKTKMKNKVRKLNFVPKIDR